MHFANLLGFLRTNPGVRMIFTAIANCRGDYRIHLVLIGQERLPICRADHFGPVRQT
jgi:hypothetical protein